MRSITAQTIQKSFGGKTVLADVNLSLQEGKRLALVGENGSGKSTLLKIITGNLQPDSGKLFGLENGSVYIAQDFSGSGEEVPRQFLNHRVLKPQKAMRLLQQAGFDLGKNEERLDQVRCYELSGGEMKKLEIVAGLTSGALFIGMDEPENHLDYQTIEWLIGTLSKFQGGLIFVSHDQYFIDQLADSVLELANGTLTTYSLKYEDYLAEKERQVGAQVRDWAVEKQTISRLRKTVEMMKRRAQRSSKTATTYQRTKKRLEHLKAKHGKRPLVDPEKPKITTQDVDQKRGKLIVSVDHLHFAYGTNHVFRDASAELRFGEKVVLFGPNGAGKSTLIRLIAGELTPQQGQVRMGVNVQWQFMTQDHLAGIDPRKLALEVFEEILTGTENQHRACLAQYGIKSDTVKQPLRVLSGGQQARFKLALTFAQEPEFLILDEPTNHVDPQTWEAIVDAVSHYSGTVLAITHDREFIDAVANKLWIIQDKQILSESGNLSDYISRKEAPLP